MAKGHKKDLREYVRDNMDRVREAINSEYYRRMLAEEVRVKYNYSPKTYWQDIWRTISLTRVVVDAGPAAKINQTKPLAKKEPEPVLPLLDYWMLTEIAEILKREEQARIKESDVGKAARSLGMVSMADRERLDKELTKLKKNRFSPVGRVSLILDRIQAIKDVYTKDITGDDSGAQNT